MAAQLLAAAEDGRLSEALGKDLEALRQQVGAQLLKAAEDGRMDQIMGKARDAGENHTKTGDGMVNAYKEPCETPISRGKMANLSGSLADPGGHGEGAGAHGGLALDGRRGWPIGGHAVGL